jgi:hypothetical protein
MDTTRVIPPIRLWYDWLLLVAALVTLCVPLYLAIDAAYGRDGAILYWLLIAYDYPDGVPAATVVGLATIAGALLLDWLSLRLLARSDFAPWRAFAAVALTSLLSLTALVALVGSYLLADGISLLPLLLTLGAGLLAAALTLGLRAVLGVWRRAPPAQSTAPIQLRRASFVALALAIVATLLLVTLAPLALLIGESPINNYSHLASANVAAQRYHLALADKPSDYPAVVLFRCDASGEWCHKLDTLFIPGDGHSAAGYLRYDTSTRLVTASEGTQIILTYPAGDLFGGP